MGQCIHTDPEPLDSTVTCPPASEPSVKPPAVFTEPRKGKDEAEQQGLQAFAPPLQGEPWRTPEPVVLNIYNLGTSGRGHALNLLLRPLGTGVFHCGVQVYGREWSYADSPMTSPRQVTGIFCSIPCHCEGHTFSQSVSMGQTGASEADVLQLLRLLRASWAAEDYHTLTRNCCHFCDEFCQRLGVGTLPAWVISLADTGAAIAAHGDTTCCREVAGQTRQAAETICCGERRHPKPVGCPVPPAPVKEESKRPDKLKL